MIGRRPAGWTLEFVNTAADASGGRDRLRTVVLDTSWTPLPHDLPHLMSVRPAIDEILDRENLFELSLDLLDEWSEAGGLADQFALDGITWWFHARSFVRLDLQELLIWSRLLEDLAPPGRYDTIVVPEDRPLLAAAIRAARAMPRPAVRIVRGTKARTSDASGRPSTKYGARAVVAYVVKRMRRATGRALRALGWSGSRNRASEARSAIVVGRVVAAGMNPGTVLGVVRSSSFHQIQTDEGPERRDPYVAPVMDQLVKDGAPVLVVALALDHLADADWAGIEADERLIPISIVRNLASGHGGGQGALRLIQRLGRTPKIRLDVGDRDLGPILRRTVVGLGPWLNRQHEDMLAAERLIARISPGALVTGWEAARTAWIGAARRSGVPSVAIEHGVIYPRTPDYCRPDHPALVRPDLTCVYGPYERQILVGQGGYGADEVVATGSPRIDPSQAVVAISPEERRAIRADLGVTEGNRMLVVSGGRMMVGDRLQNVPLLARVLNGPLGDVHLVVKLHPEEEHGEHYEALVAGLAATGGYAPPSVTIVRDIDVYQLLGAADAHLGVYSTVLTDSVFVGTPNMIVVGQAFADILGYVESGVAVPVRSAADVREFMQDPRPPAPADRDRFIAAHYREGDAAQRIASLIEGVVVNRGARDPAPRASD